jgi:hypothetical protein
VLPFAGGASPQYALVAPAEPLVPAVGAPPEVLPAAPLSPCAPVPPSCFISPPQPLRAFNTLRDNTPMKRTNQSIALQRAKGRLP